MGTVNLSITMVALVVGAFADSLFDALTMYKVVVANAGSAFDSSLRMLRWPGLADTFQISAVAATSTRQLADNNGQSGWF